MSDPVDALVFELLEWIGPGARPYAEVMDAWRTSCPRLPVWEEANSRGYIGQRHREGTPALICVTLSGLEALKERNLANAPVRESHLL